MTDVTIDCRRREAASGKGTVVNRSIPESAFDLFAGEQLVLVGRYQRRWHGQGDDPGRSRRPASKTFDFPAELVDKSGDDTNAFVDKLWAMRRVGEIIDEIDLKGRNEELVKELVALATEHGILTPYTSFLADETSRSHELSENVRRRTIRSTNYSASSRGKASWSSETPTTSFSNWPNPT